MKKNSTAIYRTLLREAWRLTWQRKTLWIFGIFAAIVSTGGVFDVATTGMQRIQIGGSFLHRWLGSTVFGYTMFGTYVKQAQTLSTFQTGGIIFCMVLISAGLIFLAVLSQTALIHGLKSPTHEHPNIIRKRAHDHIGRIFILDILTKLAGSILVGITILPMAWYLTTFSSNSFLFTFTELIFFFPLILIINIISFLAIIHVIETEATVLEAITDAWNLFRKHWLATFEYAIILFLLIALSAFALLAIAIFLTIPYAFVYSLSLLTGSFVIFVLANVLFGLIALSVIFAFGGMVVTFQYSSWYLFYKQADLPLHKRLPIAKTLRLFGIK